MSFSGGGGSLLKGFNYNIADIKQFFDKESLADVVLTLHDTPQVCPKALRLWWKLSSSTTITVLTGAGLTDKGEAGPVLGQGSSGGSLASQKNLDQGIEDYMAGSTGDNVYGSMRLQPLCFVDDLMRSSDSVSNTRTGN